MSLYLKRLWDTIFVPLRDLRFLWIAVLFSVLALWLDPEGINALRIVFWVILFWGLAHALRKTLLPYAVEKDGKRIPIKMSHLLKKSLEDPIASAICFASIIYLLCCIAESFAIWMR